MHNLEMRTSRCSEFADISAQQLTTFFPSPICDPLILTRVLRHTTITHRFHENISTHRKPPPQPDHLRAKPQPTKSSPRHQPRIPTRSHPRTQPPRACNHGTGSRDLCLNDRPVGVFSRGWTNAAGKIHIILAIGLRFVIRLNPSIEVRLGLVMGCFVERCRM
jgi:hypothetical protein